MTEKVLNFDQNIVPQEKGWDCGPASTQVVLNGLGIFVSENDLIAQIRTTTNGTDDISWIENRALDVRVPQANYTRVYMPNDPPSGGQVEKLWADCVQSINAGFGIVANIVSPASNPPRGVKGSQSPVGYGRYTIFHYVPIMGYDDNYDGRGGRAFLIPDPGFRPFRYWVTLEQMATLIPPKGYCYANVGTVVNPSNPPRPPSPTSDAINILAQAAGISTSKAQEILPTLSAGLVAAQCNNVNRIAAALAQWGHESASFNATAEYASGDAYDTRTDLGNTPQVDGDGALYKGRTWIQITGKNNYRAFSRWAFDRGLVPTPTYFVDHPLELSDIKWAGIGAAWYWVVQQPKINEYADRGDIENVSKLINAPAWVGTSRLAHGNDDRNARWNRARALGDQLLILVNTTEQGILGGLFMSGINVGSRALYKSPGEGDIYKPEEMLEATDGNAYDDRTETRAKRGSLEAFNRILRVASGGGAYPSPENAEYARNTLIELGGQSVHVIRLLTIGYKGGDKLCGDILTRIQILTPEAIEKYKDYTAKVGA